LRQALNLYLIEKSSKYENPKPNKKQKWQIE